MKIYPSEVKRIIDTLPIGYYADKQIPIEMSEKEDTSFYSPKTKKIVISFKQIENALSEVEDLSYLETGVRSMVYHEVSHVLLTPPDMEWSDIINVFEDERIETILAGYYMNVDFKKNIQYVNNWHGEKPTNSFEKFYYTVRFRSGEAAHLAELKKIISDFRRINFSYSTYNKWKVNEYVLRIKDFYRLVTGEEPPESSSSRPESSGISADSLSPQTSSGENNHGDSEDKKTSSIILSDKAAKQFDEKEVNDCLKNVVWDLEYMIPTLNADPKLVEQIAMIFDNFKRKTGGGSALQGYSGVLNPRNIAREDYKYFDRFAKKTGVNKFGTVHLNLFLDVSGSFSRNEAKTNSLLLALEEMEKRNPFFTFDIVACGESEKILQKSNRFVKCSGGNNLDNKIYEIFRLLQRPNTYNYNIALFDGDAYSDAPEDCPCDTFRVFNVSNCTIISEKSNKEYIEKNVNRAKVIITKEYTETLLKHIVETLTLALH